MLYQPPSPLLGCPFSPHSALQMGVQELHCDPPSDLRCLRGIWRRKAGQPYEKEWGPGAMAGSQEKVVSSGQSGWLPGLSQQNAQDVPSGRNLQPSDADLISFETRGAGILPLIISMTHKEIWSHVPRSWISAALWSDVTINRMCVTT